MRYFFCLLLLLPLMCGCIDSQVPVAMFGGNVNYYAVDNSETIGGGSDDGEGGISLPTGGVVFGADQAAGNNSLDDEGGLGSGSQYGNKYPQAEPSEDTGEQDDADETAGGDKTINRDGKMTAQIRSETKSAAGTTATPSGGLTVPTASGYAVDRSAEMAMLRSITATIDGDNTGAAKE